MADSKSTSGSKEPKTKPRKLYKDMTPKEKVVFVLQVLICVLTFGMVYPNAFG